MKNLHLFLVLCAVLPAVPTAGQTYTYSTAASVYGAGGVALDANGDFFASTYYHYQLLRFSPQGTSAVLAGANSSAGAADGPGAAARFGNLRGLAVDAAGNVYLADASNHTVRKVSPGGVVTTLAGLAGSRGSQDGPGTSARFDTPQGVALDLGGNLVIADTRNHTIRRITPDGVVSTLAGAAGEEGVADGAGPAARFLAPQGVAVDRTGRVLVADTGNHAIRQVTSGGVVSTLAGYSGSRGAVDGPGRTARFDSPQGVAVDGAGTVFVADTGNCTVRAVSPLGVVTTIGGVAQTPSETNGTGAAARFYTLRGIAVDRHGTLFLADAYSIRLGAPAGQPAITVAPQAQAVAAGGPLILTTTATGAAPLNYQWQKNGAPIAGATNETLVFPSVQAGDSATYTVTVANPLGTVASTGALLTVLAPLGNNAWADAQEIPPEARTISGTNLGATGEAAEPTHFLPAATASSVWFRWKPTQAGRTTFSSSGPTAVVVALYTGTSLENLRRVAQGGLPLSVAAAAGTTYFLAVGSSGGVRGNFTLNWETIPNDDFALATDLAGNSGATSGSNSGATGELNEPAHWNSAANSIWYRWTPTQSGTAVFDTVGSAVDTVLAVYTGATLGGLGLVAQDNDSASQAGSYGASRVAFVATAGTTYRIAIGSYSFATGRTALNWQLTLAPVITRPPMAVTVPVGASTSLSVTAVSFLPVTYQWQRNGVTLPGATGATYLLPSAQPAEAGTYVAIVANGGGAVSSAAAVVTLLIPPANDNFANARSLAGTFGTVTGSNVNATGESGEPAHWNLAGAATSVWHRWTAPGNGLAIFDTVGSAFDTVMAVYTGASLESLTRLAQDDDRGGGRTSQVSFAVTAGSTYHLAVGGNSLSARGALTLNWQLSLAVSIATQPVGQAVSVGESATFRVTATGVGLAYQWARNGQDIPGATSPTLTVGSIAAGDDAAYTVTVRSSNGSVTSAPATLTVTAPAVAPLATRRWRREGDLLWSIAGGAGEMVTVGSAGVILSSSDGGLTWAPRESGSTGWLVAVTYGGGQFVIVGEGGLILTSPDGRSWSRAAESGTTERLNNVVYAEGKYVAVGEKGVVVTSPDGRRWTRRTTPVTTWLHGLAYHPGLRHFAACGEGAVFLYSADGVTWSQLPVPGFSAALQHTVAVDSYASFVAVGEHGMLVSVRRNELALKDGQTLVTWTAETHPTGTTAHLIGLVQGAGALFAVGYDGIVITATSDRGPWTTVRSNSDQLLLAGVFERDTLYVVGGGESILQSERLFGSRLVNLSTRGEVGVGGSLMISGFVVTGDRPKQVLLRAAGPTLALFGLTGTLPAPQLTLTDGQGRTVAANAGWSGAANAAAVAATAARVGAFPFGAGSADAALLTTLAPGAYTAQVSGANNSTGVTIVEVYDTDAISNEGARAINISTRGLVGTGARQLIAGFVLEGAAARRVLIRAVGPGLASFGVAGALAEPVLELFNGRNLPQGTAAAWGLQANADEIRGAAKAVGAFDLADGSKDAALLVTLFPGAWTVQVAGANNGVGVALVEVYVMP